MTSGPVLAERNRAFEIVSLARKHGLADLGDESLTRGDSVSAFRTRLASRLALRELGGTFSFQRALLAMNTQQGLDGLERELAQETAKGSPDGYHPNRLIVPWALFQRDLTTSVASAGGFLVGTELGEAVDVLRPWSVVTRAGVTIIENLKSGFALPRTTTKATGFWLGDQATSIIESTPALGQIALEPKTGGAYIEYSRQFALQAGSSGEIYVRRELLRTIGTLIDQAVLNGSGAAGQPLGLLNTPGIGSQSGTALAHAGVTNMKESVATANAPDDGIAFLGTPAVRELLENRERATGSGFIWDADQVASRPAFVSTDLPTGTLICGAWSDLVLALWGPGIEFSVNPFAKFQQNIIGARVVVSCDVALQHPAAFIAASSIT